MAKNGGAFPAKNGHLSLLLEISGALAALHDSKTLFQKITDYSVELLKLGSAAIYLLEGENLRLEATFPPLPAEFPDELRYASQRDHPRVQQAILTGEPVLVADTRGSEQTPAEKEINTLRSLRSLLFLPLIYQDKRLGVLIVGSVDTPHEFTADEVNVCQALANLAALQIEATRQHEANQGYISMLEREIEERRATESRLQESEVRYRTLFEDSPVSLWEEDYSAIKQRFEELRAQGVTDLAAYLEANPEEVAHCASLARVIDVNQASLDIYKARSKDDLKGNLVKILGDESKKIIDERAYYREELTWLAEGRTRFSCEAVNRTMDGELIDIHIICMMPPEHEKDWERLIFAVTDISERKRTERQILQSEARFRLLIENAPVGIFVQTEHKFAYLNPAALRMFGAQKDEDLLGTPVLERFHPDYHAIVKERIQNLNVGKTSVPTIEEIFLRMGGQPFDVEVSAVPIQWEGKDGALVFFQDISEKKFLERQLQENYDLLRVASEKAIFGAWSVDLASNLVTWSDMVADIHEMPRGYSPKVEDGIAFYAPEWREKITRVFTDCAQKGIPYDEEMQIITKKGKKVWVRTIGEAIRDEDGTITKVQGAFQDISTRKQAEKDLRESDALLAHAQQIAHLGSWTNNVPANRLTWSDEVFRIFDCEAQEFEATYEAFLEFVHPDDRAAVDEAYIRSVRERCDGYEIEHRIIRKKTGEIRFVHERCINEFDDDGAVIRSIGIVQDITDQTHKQEAEKALARRVEAGLRAGNLAWWEMELPSGKVRFDDRKAEMLGYEPARFKTYRDFTLLLHPDDRRKAMQAMQDHLDGKKETYEVEYRIRTSDGSYKWLRDIGAITESDPHSATTLVIGIVDDISQRKEAELALEAYSSRLEDLVAERTRALNEAQRELIEKEKLATMGQLAGGVGHELRNPLGVINNAVYILKATLAEDNEKAREYADMIAQQVQRSNKIISDLLNFAREPAANRGETDLAALAARVLADFPPPEGIRVRKSIAKGQPKALADAQQVEQILANLVSNAYQAMPEGGQVSVSISRKRGEARIAVRDRGAGISPENLEKLFVPLFTTKAKGIGLGLATSRKLAEANGGRIEVKSEVGKGSTFTLVLPAAGEENGG